MSRSCYALRALLASLLFVGVAQVGFAEDDAEDTVDSVAPLLVAAQPEAPSPSDRVPGEYYGEIVQPRYGEVTVDEGFAAPTAIGWTLQLDTLFLTRAAHGPALVDGGSPYGATNLDLPISFGPRVDLVKHNLFGTSWGAEFLFFSVDGFLARQSSNGATTLFTNPNVTFAARNVTSTYRERLYNTELNLRLPVWDGVTFLHGFRWIEMRDDLLNHLGNASHQIITHNHLYGYQIGADGRLFSWGKFDVNVWSKAGLFADVADQGTSTAGIAGAVATMGANSSHLSFVGDLGITGTYRFTDQWSFRTGYQALMITSTATAMKQIPVSNIVTGAATLDMRDTLIFHGGFFGVEYAW